MGREGVNVEIPTLEEFNELKRDMKLLADEIHLLNLLYGAPPIDAKEIARREGLSPRSVYHNDYIHYLPNFGVSDYPDGRKRWKFETYMNWIKIPPTERKSMWINMSAREREKIVVKKGRQIPA